MFKQVSKMQVHSLKQIEAFATACRGSLIICALKTTTYQVEVDGSTQHPAGCVSHRHNSDIIGLAHNVWLDLSHTVGGTENKLPVVLTRGRKRSFSSLFVWQLLLWVLVATMCRCIFLHSSTTSVNKGPHTSLLKSPYNWEMSSCQIVPFCEWFDTVFQITSQVKYNIWTHCTKMV